MQKTTSKSNKFAALLVAIVMVMSVFSVNAFAASATLEDGTYTVDASLSCYVTAMGGIDFGDSLLTDMTVTVENGVYTAHLNLTKSVVTIYGVTCDTFIDATSSKPGYYENGELKSAAYTLSENTALNSASENVNYVDSITFELSELQDEYTMYLYVNSNVMGVQFGLVDGTEVRYAGKLTVDWDTAEKVKTADESNTQSANVTYTVEGGYEVKIPAAITVDPKTKTGAYIVEAENFVLNEGAYVTVTADESGVLSNGSSSLAFTNELADGKLTKTGDSLDGTVTVTENATAAGTYNGTINFTINYFAE